MTIEIPLTKGMKTIIDDIDGDLSNLKWHLVKSSCRNYVRRKGTRIHRVILSRMLERDLLDTEYCDHINGDTLDNRRENLRLATRSQNGANMKIKNKNTSGYKGVSWNKKQLKWHARVKLNGKNIHLGYFENVEDAAQAYREAAIKYHGDFARYD